MGTPKGYWFLELDNLEEEVRQLGITNDNLSTQLEEAVEQMDGLKAKVWKWETKQPPSFSLYRSYELQRNLFLTLNNLTKG